MVTVTKKATAKKAATKKPIAKKPTAKKSAASKPVRKPAAKKPDVKETVVPGSQVSSKMVGKKATYTFDAYGYHYTVTTNDHVNFKVCCTRGIEKWDDGVFTATKLLKRAKMWTEFFNAIGVDVEAEAAAA